MTRDAATNSGPRPAWRRQALTVFLVVLAVAGFTAQVFSVSATKLQPRYDEVEYLSISRQYQREGGMVATIRCHIEGRCRQDARHPLYQFVLLPFTDDDPTFYADAKLLTYVTALLLMAVAFLCARSVFSTEVAAATVVGLCLFTALAELSAGVLCDVLFAALSVACVYLIARCQERGILWWVAAGAAIGLAFQTKGNGHIFLAALFATSLHRHRLRLFIKPHPYLAATAFVAVTFFLLWRNVKVFGSAFHNLNTRTIWLDNWQDFWTMGRESNWSDVGPFWYLERHTVWDLIVRIANGFVQTCKVFVYTAGFGVSAATPGIGPLTAGVVLPRALTGLTVIGLGLWGMVRRYRDGHRDEVLAIAYSLFFFFGAFSIGAQGVGIGTRYMIPFSVLFVPYAASTVMTRLTPWLARRWPAVAASVETALKLTVAAALVAKLIWFAPALATGPRSFYHVPVEWAETSAWLAGNLKPGELFGIPSSSLYSTWDRPFPDPDSRWPYTYQTDAATMRRHAREASVAKFLIDTHDPDFGRYEDKLSKDRDAHGPLALLDWPRCFSDGKRPSRFLIYCRLQ